MNMKVKLFIGLSDKMKNVGIITLNGDYNFGNKLQNYALIKFIEDNFNCTCCTIWTSDIKDNNYLKKFLRFILKSKGYLRERNFKRFNKYLKIKKYAINNIKDECDKYIIGSDQVWNYNDPIFSSYKYFALFSAPKKNISYAASFGVSEIESNYVEIFKNGLSNIEQISVRESSGKKIVEKITGRKDVQLVIDPTMLLDANEWNKISRKPKKHKNEKFILNYFLGNLTSDKKNEINRIAKENNCIIINILEKGDPYYTCGPSEFLWLVKNSFLVCTDSFHASVFSILFNRPFIVFDRDDKLKKMSSRIDTLLDTFELKDRRYNGNKIMADNLKHDYSNAYMILKKEINKSKSFLKNSLEK